MKSRESVDSISTKKPYEQPERKPRDASFASTSVSPNYESASFAKPALDQYRGVFPDLNRRLSPERDLGLSPAGQPRLSSEAHPRLFSARGEGLSAAMPLEATEIRPEVSARDSFEVEPGLPARTVTEKFNRAFGLEADSAIRPVESRFFEARQEKQEKENRS
ncbi:MAG: hypothetical protein PHW56_05960 [Methanosarcinaceae archaeon]|nr:hypothetical protein [Methanosarcinaceae archaeon]